MGWVRRFWNVLSSRKLDQEIEEELQFHLRSRAEDSMARGMRPAEAQQDARRRFGSKTLALESARETNIFVPIQDLAQDIRFASRLFRRWPAFTALVVLLLGLGIGASTAMFSLLMHAVFPTNGFDNSPRLVFLGRFDKRQSDLERMSYLDLSDIRSESRSFERMSIYRFELVNVNATGEPESIQGLAIDPYWLPTVGVSPTMGRNLVKGERNVALLTMGLAQRLFQTEINAVGQSLRIGNQAFTVIGILPASFRFYEAEILVPLVPGTDAQQRDNFAYHSLAQTHAGVTLAQAQAEARAIVPGREFWTVRLLTYKEELAGECGPTCGQRHLGAWLLFGAAAVIMLLACANVANLLLSRSVGRSHEFVIRTAIGCSRPRLIRQMLTESLVLFGCGGAVGVMLAWWFSTLLFRFAAAYVDSATAANGTLLDPRALSFVATATLITALLFGLVPAVHFSSGIFRRGGRDSHAGAAKRRHNSVRGLLIASEFTLSLVLLVGFGLLLQSFLEVESIPVGIRAEDLVTISANVAANYPKMPERIGLANNLLNRVRLIPAVSSAAITSSLPLTGAGDTRIRIAGAADSPTEVRYVSVSSNYFEAMGIPIVYGRPFSEHDSAGAAAVVVINETMARALFPSGNALGQRIKMDDTPPVWREIVGVAADIRQRNLEEDSRPVFYRPYTQGIDFDLSVAVRVRSGAEVGQVARVLRETVREADPQISWQPVKSMRQIIYDSESLSLRRPIVKLLGAFGAMALILTATGLFAVLSQAVAERTREIGIRMAVGARPAQVLTQIFGEMLKFIIPGAFIGAGCAYLLSTLLPSGHIGWSGSGVFLYGVVRFDMSTYIGVFALLLLISAVAVSVPARRATRIDPWLALREQ